MREFDGDWWQATAVMVPFLRAEVGTELDDPEVARLVAELLDGSERFRTLWRRHDVARASRGELAVNHAVGPIDLVYRRLHLPEQRVVVVTYHARPRTASYDRLAALAEGA